MSTLETEFNYSSLSVKDLLEAREAFHVHLMRKQNVIATAIGRTRHRIDYDDTPEAKRDLQTRSREKTLLDTEVRDTSLPCVLVFVKKWEVRERMDPTDFVPPRIYMPDGRVVPVCVLKAERLDRSDPKVEFSQLRFPQNLISGGFPLIVTGQGMERVASIACVVSDGSKYFALTNRHAVGDPGTPVYTMVRRVRMRIGISARKQLGQVKFTEVYPCWPGAERFVELDAGLIEIDDAEIWKTEVFGIGPFDHLADLSPDNMSLDLINVDDNALVRGYGCVSGLLKGEIAALFYRYKTLGGVEYVSDFLIGPRRGGQLGLHHGDSGMLWLLERRTGDVSELRPIALHWGEHDFMDSTGTGKHEYGLATSLTNVCRLLELDVIRGWNLDQPYTWGKTGHFKVAAQACSMVKNKNLRTLLEANLENIGYTDAQLNAQSGIVKAGSGKFTPLADVPDLVWKYPGYRGYHNEHRRPDEGPNHYVNADKKGKGAYANKTLAKIWAGSGRTDIKEWRNFYTSHKAAKRDRGALPFRVWQLYNEMVRSLTDKDVIRFICAGGTASHYVADAAMPLHLTQYSDGKDKSQKGVHAALDELVVDANRTDLLAAVAAGTQKPFALKPIKGGRAAASAVIDLMLDTCKAVPPQVVFSAYDKYGAAKDWGGMWQALREPIVARVVKASQVMATLWESAWIEGKGDTNIPPNKRKDVGQTGLQKLYESEDFTPSYSIDDPSLDSVLT
jgi:hypothetical protein